MSETGKLMHTQIIPVRWGDQDALGHLNNSKFFTYYEQTRVSWLEKISHSLSILNKQGPVIINANCNFYKPIVYPATVLVELYGSDPGRTSFMTYHKMYIEGDKQTLYADGHAKVVWVDYVKNKAIRIPDFILEEINK